MQPSSPLRAKQLRLRKFISSIFCARISHFSQPPLHLIQVPPPNTHAIFGNLALSSVQSVFVCRPNSKQFSTFVTSIIKFNALLFRLFLSLPQQAGCLEAFLFPLRGAFGQSQQNARKKSATRLRQKAKKKQQKTM